MKAIKVKLDTQARRVTSIVLAVVLAFSLVPLTSAAAGNEEGDKEGLVGTAQATATDTTTGTKVTFTYKLYEDGTATLVDVSSLEGVEDVTVPSSVSHGDATYSLAKIVFPESVTTIPKNFCKSCRTLVSVEAKGQITSIGEAAFNSCSKLADIFDLSHVTNMGARAFYGCTKPDDDMYLTSLEVIPEGAFTNSCITIKEFCPSLKSIGATAFQALAFILYYPDRYPPLVLDTTFPDTLESIGTQAFANAKLPETIVIPDSVTNLGGRAFEKSTGATTFIVGSGVSEVLGYTFNTTNASEITVVIYENVKVATGGIPSSANTVYATDTGNRIRDDADAPTLQEAVNAASDGDTITVEKSVRLDEELVIPTGKNITIKSDSSAGSYTIFTTAKTKLDYLITVEEGASATFAGNIQLDGANVSSGIILNKGIITLTDNAIACGVKGISTSNAGVIYNTGKDARFVMSGGKVSNNIFSGQNYGSIVATNGATIDIQGGEISSNQAETDNAEYSSPGILLRSNASGTMTGGTITGNFGYRGSAIMLYSYSRNESVSFVMNGGTISKNYSSQKGSHDSSGAVHVEGNASFTLNDGLISENNAVNTQSSIGVGGGVCVVDPGIKGAPYKTAFTMNGGTISKNKAYTGGGIYSFSDYVELNAGYIYYGQYSVG